MTIIFSKKEHVFVGIIYYMPSYTSILNEFYWQTEDLVPEIPRVHKFLTYWHEHINAVIKEVQISTASNKRFTLADFDGKIN